MLSSLLTLMSFLGVSVGEAYLTLLDLAVILQLLPTCYLFGALLKHTLDGKAVLNASKPYLLANGVAGLLAATVGLIVAFIPSRQVNSIWLYEIKLIVGCVLVFGSAYLFYRNSLKTAPSVEPLADAPPRSPGPASKEIGRIASCRYAKQAGSHVHQRRVDRRRVEQSHPRLRSLH